MLSRSKPYQDFIVTKSVGNCGTDSSEKYSLKVLQTRKALKKYLLVIILYLHYQMIKKQELNN